MQDTQKDPFNPAHYRSCTGMQAIDAIDEFELNFNLGNVVKYVIRCNKKGCRTVDLRKAMWYLNRELMRIGVKGSPDKP